MLIVTLRGKLEQSYSPAGYPDIRKALNAYAQASNAIVVAIDDPFDCRQHALAPVLASESSAILLSIRALRAKYPSLADSLLIAGDDAIVPQFRLANPVQDRSIDPDSVVLSDNPYGSDDETLEE